MNFMEAVKAMKEGKKVRREAQISDVYFELDIEILRKHNGTETVLLDLTDLEGTDWEIYEEEDNWNLADEMLNGETIRDQIRLFIQKVKEDFEEENKLRWKKPGSLLETEKINEIIDKRAGDL